MSKILHITNIELYEYLVADGNTYFYHSVSKSDTIKCGLALRADQNFALYKNYNDGKFRIARAINGSYSNFLWGTVSVWYRQIDPDYNDFVFRIGNNDNFIFTINDVTYTETNNTVDSELNCKFGINGKCKYLHFNDNEKLIPAKLKGTLYQGNAADAKIHYEDECGMFDIVNNIFYANESATGTFTVENKIDEIKINGDIKYIAIAEDSNTVVYLKKVYFASSNNTLKLVYERPTYDIHIINLAIDSKLGNADKITDIVFTNNLLLQKKAYDNNIVDVTFNHFKTVEFLVQNADNDTFTCYIANPFWGGNSKVYCYGSFISCFDGCVLLQNIPTEIFDISYVTDISYIFRNCKAVQLLDLRNWDFIKVRNSYCAFANCNSIVKILGNFNNFTPTSQIALSSFLSGCNNLKNIDLSNIDTRYITSVSGLFYNCSSLKRVDISNFNLQNVGIVSSAFWNCKSLNYLKLPDFSNANITRCDDMFRWCYSLKSIYLRNINTSLATRMSSMFVGNTNLFRIFSEDFNTISLQDFEIEGITVHGDYELFVNCNNLKGGNGTTYSYSHANSAEYARIDGENGLPGYFTDPADAIKITLINVDNENFTDEIYLKSGDTYSIPTLEGYTAVVTDNNGNTYSDGDTITINQDITLTFVWTAVNNN